MGGFVLTPGGRLAYLRWVPGKGYPNVWTEATQTLRFCVPERSRTFLHGPIEAAMREKTTVNVLLLFGNNRYDAGDFHLQSYDGATLLLVRRRFTAAATPPPASQKSAEVAETLLVPRDGPLAVDSLFEGQYRRLFQAWCVAANYRRMMFRLSDVDAGASNATWYTPDGLGGCAG